VRKRAMDAEMQRLHGLAIEEIENL